jgi:hypothetical protein
MRSTQEWLNRQGDVDCASRKSPPLVRPLVGWLVDIVARYTDSVLVWRNGSVHFRLCEGI